MMQRCAQRKGTLGRGKLVSHVLFVSLGLQNLASTIKACWADVVTQVLLARVWLDGRWGID